MCVINNFIRLKLIDEILKENNINPPIFKTDSK